MTRSMIWLALCALAPLAVHAGTLQVSVVDKEGKPVQDAVVVLVTSTRGAPKTPLATQVTISQEKMRFVPAVSVVALGARGNFVNNDPWAHHVRVSPAGAMEFNSSAGGFEVLLDGKPDGKPAKTAESTFDKPGAMLLGCHLHASMRGHVYVSDSPWAALTGAEGTTAFEAVPSGPVFVRVWQADQLIDVPAQQLTLTDSPAKAVVHLTVVPRRRRV
ncbi:MAG: plastocyanin [Ramlibacter sp.]|nr:plastocyanin [Ramlibacter sp.]